MSCSILTALLIVDEFLVLVKESLFQFVVGLWILLGLLLLRHIANCLAIALNDLDGLVAVSDVGVLDCVLARGDKLVIVIASNLGAMLSYKLIVNREAIEGLIV